MALERIDGVLKLTAETKATLEQKGKEVASINHTIAVLKQLGMDTTEIDSKMQWAEKVRLLLLKEFG